MKTTKRIVSIILTVCMLVVMSIPAFADAPNSLTITGAKSGHSYDAVKVFGGTLAEDNKTLENIVWSDDVDGAAVIAALQADSTFGTGDANDFAKAKSAAQVAKVLNGYENDSAKLDKFAEIVTAKIKDNATKYPSTASENGNYVINNLPNGYYIVLDTTELEKDVELDALSKTILSIPATKAIEVKSDIPTIDKKIVKADGTKVTNDSAEVGKIVNYELTSEVPDMDGYTSYDYIVTDTITKGLDYVLADNKVNVEITIGGNPYTDFKTSLSSDGKTLTITFNNLINYKSTETQAIVIKYAAKINAEAFTSDKEKNTVKLTYSNNPKKSSDHGTTPEKKTYVYDADIDILKVDGADNTTPLDGAQFVLMNKDKSAYYKLDGNVVTWVEKNTVTDLAAAIEAGTVTAKTTADGKAKFVGLENGKYYLKETVAPAGYNLPGENTYFEVVINETIDEATGTVSGHTSVNGNQPVFNETVANNSGMVLPSTGGIGTKIFYVLGSLLAVAAVILLVTRRRMSNEAE